MTTTERNALRQAVADYMRSEGCSCCRNIAAHAENERRLAKLLRVPKYDDGSGYDFGRWTGNRLADGELEPRYGRTKRKEQ